MSDRALPPPSAGKQLVKVSFPLKPGEWEGLEAENMWAEPVGIGKYRVENTPFYAYGVSAGDIVNAESRGGVLTFAGIAERGGHSTYRLLLSDQVDVRDSRFVALWSQLQSMGCTYEGASSKWLAVEVPPHADIYKAYSLFEEGEEQGTWTFDEGHCGHPVAKRNGQSL
jgi:hypothetical protein